MKPPTYFERMAGITPPDPFDPTAERPAPEAYVPRKEDTVELPELLATDGGAAEISARIYQTEQQRRDLERALELT